MKKKQTDTWYNQFLVILRWPNTHPKKKPDVSVNKI